MERELREEDDERDCSDTVVVMVVVTAMAVAVVVVAGEGRNFVAAIFA